MPIYFLQGIGRRQKEKSGYYTRMKIESKVALPYYECFLTSLFILTYYYSFVYDRHTALVEQNVLQVAKDMEKVLDVPISQFVEENPPPLHPPSYPLPSKQFSRRHGRDLFSCAASWFLVDIVFYSSNLFQSQIYNQYVPKADKVNAYQDAFNIAKLQAIVAICSTIPGYWVTVCFIDHIGRVKIQQNGFFCMAIV